MKMYRHLTPHERTRIVSYARQKEPIAQIAKLLHRSEATISNVLYEAGFLKDKEFDSSNLLTVTEICKKLKISRNPVLRLAKKLGIEPTTLYASNKFYFTPSEFETMKNSSEYANILNSRLHKKNRPTLKKKFPLTDQPRLCANCRHFYKSNRFCAPRGITLSRLSTQLSYLDCVYYEEMEKKSDGTPE